MEVTKTYSIWLNAHSMRWNLYLTLSMLPITRYYISQMPSIKPHTKVITIITIAKHSNKMTLNDIWLYH